MTETTADVGRMPVEQVEATMGSIKRMLMIGALFAVVGYLLVGMALFFELTQFHPAIDGFVSTYTDHSLAGGGPDRAGVAGIDSALATIHQWPSLLLWLKLGGVAHVLVGIFIALAAIVRTLSLVPIRLSYEMDRAPGVGRGRGRDTGDVPGGETAPGDDD